jgi:iron complex outermembrane receptor protein
MANDASEPPETSDGVQSQKPGPDLRGFVVLGQHTDGIFESIAPQDELSEDDIAGYGLDKVGDVNPEIFANVRSGGNAPIILINGERASGLDDVTDLPTEAVTGSEWS